MNTHASQFDLHETAAGLAPEAIRAHVQACEACAAALERVRAARDAAAESPRFEQTFAALPARRSATRWTWRLPAALGAAGAAAAALLLIARPAEVRTKGGPSLTVSGHATAVHAGDELELRALAAQHPFVLIAALEPGTAAPVVLWPAGASESGRVPPGEQVLVKVRFTPGPVRIVAAFSEAPVTPATLRSAAELRELEFHPLP